MALALAAAMLLTQAGPAAAEDVTEAVTEDVTESVTEDVTEAMTEDVTESATEAAAETAEDADAAAEEDGQTMEDAGEETSEAVSGVITAQEDNELRGLWIGFNSFGPLGLKDASENAFRAAIYDVLERAGSLSCNTIFWHVRAFDDASWKSETFKASRYLTSEASDDKTAAETYEYDPTAIVIELCREMGLSVHAWLNPYRITTQTYYDPATEGIEQRVLQAIKELEAYDFDGIHFDDYFYSASESYLVPDTDTLLDIVPAEETTFPKDELPEAEVLCDTVNEMLLTTYEAVHSHEGWVFGVSPSGNIDNNLLMGVDVAEWMSGNAQYIDYLAPQIYWTDTWGSSAAVTMFSDRLNMFTERNQCGMPLYIGLFANRAGQDIASDPGWKMADDNLVQMVKEVRSRGLAGYILFSDISFEQADSQAELENLKEYLDEGGSYMVTASFPDWYGYTDDTLVMNETFSFTGYEGQGRAHLTVDSAVESYELYVNGTKVDTSATIGGGNFDLDLSSLLKNGSNAIYVTNILPATMEKAVTVSVEYPEVIEGTPEEVGIDSAVFDLIDSIVSADVENGFSSAQLAVIKDGKLIYRNAWGQKSNYSADGTRIEDGEAADNETMYDLASVTKMFAGVYAVQYLVSQGKLDLDTKAVDILGPAFADDTIILDYSGYDRQYLETQKEWKASITVRNLLNHTAGFQASPLFYDPWYNQETYEREVPETEAPETEEVTEAVTEAAGEEAAEEMSESVTEAETEEVTEAAAEPETETETEPETIPMAGGEPVNVFYVDSLHTAEGRAATYEMINRMPLQYEPGTSQKYSDIDYMLIAEIVEKVTGRRLDAFLNSTFWNKLGLSRITFNPLENGYAAEDCAATEIHGNTRDGLVNVPGYRLYTLQGEVHDEAAWYLMNGVSGHAGLFASATDLAKLASLMLTGGYGQNSFFDANVLDLFTSVDDLDTAKYSLGWMRQGNAQRVYYFGPAPSDTVGHQGWTGTLAMIDPENDLIVVYLTNKINTPVISPEEGFEGSKFTASTLGFVPQLIYLGMETDPDSLDALLDSTVGNMALSKLRLVAAGNAADADAALVRSGYAVLDVLAERCAARGTDELETMLANALTLLDETRDAAKIQELQE